MKEISKLLHFIFSFICVSALFSCTADESITKPTACITIKVETEDFIPQAATRVPAEEGYKTVFKGGEQIGITVVKDGKIVDGINNICFTYDASTVKWTAAEGSPSLYHYQDVTYLAYYPYDAAMNDKMTEQAIIDAFTPQTDQSTYANYTASDLMVATGTADRATKMLTLPLRHTMALISVSAVTEKFVTPAGYVYSPGEEFAVRNLAETSITVGTQTLTPCSFADGTFRVIVPPVAAAQTINIQYKWVELTDFTDQTQQTLASGKYLHYRFKMPESVPYVREVQGGDFFYRDGRILPRETLVINDPANCVGVVLDAASGSDASYGGQCESNMIHGHAFSVYDVGRCKWGPNGNIGTNTSDSWNDWRGYQITQRMKQDADENYGGLSPDNYAAAHYCLNYGNTERGRLETSKTSGWYFPSEGYMFRLEGWKLGVVRASLSKLAALGCGADFTNSYYWDSSTASSDATARRVNILRGGTGAMGSTASRSSSNYVRAALTF